MALLTNTTEFKCKICGEPMEFDISDDKTFISKTEHEDFFGMRLTTFRVAHNLGIERHYNSVVVDHVGLFRGHRDAYSEPIDSIGRSPEQKYWVYHEDEGPSEPTNGISFALLISSKQHWVIDIVCPASMNASETATLILKRVNEARLIYNEIPQPMETHFADLDFYIWTSDSRVLCICFKNQKILKSMESLASHIIEESEGSIIPRRRTMNLVFQLLEHDPNLSPEMLNRIMNEDMLFAKLQTPFEDRIPSIVERTATRHPIAKDILGPILRGYMTLIEIFEGKASTRYKEIIELVDFVNRRRILG